MTKEGNDEIFHEEEELGSLTSRSRNAVYKYVFEYIKLNFTVNAKTDDIVKVCRTAVKVFPTMKTESQVNFGIVSLFNRILDSAITSFIHISGSVL